MTGTGYFLTEDEIRFFRALQDRVAALEAQALAEVPVGSSVTYFPPVRSAAWSDTRFEAMASNWNHWYQLNDFNSDTVADQSENPSFDGILAGQSSAVFPILGQLGGLSSDGGKSVYFWGKEKSRIDLPLLISTERGWSMEAIFKPEVLPQEALIFYNGNELVNGHGIGIASSQLLLRVPGGAAVETGINLIAGQWYDVIFVSNSSDNKLYWYVSTITPLTKAFTIQTGSAAQPSFAAPTTQAAIGARGPSGELPFKGWISEVSTWGSQLSGAEALFSAHDRLRTSLEPAAPFGWVKPDGINVSRSKFARLFNRLGTKEGAGNGSTTFTLPNEPNSLLRI